MLCGQNEATGTVHGAGGGGLAQSQSRCVSWVTLIDPLCRAVLARSQLRARQSPSARTCAHHDQARFLVSVAKEGDSSGRSVALAVRKLPGSDRRAPRCGTLDVGQPRCIIHASRLGGQGLHWAAIVGAGGALATGLALLVSIFTLRETRLEFRAQQVSQTLVRLLALTARIRGYLQAYDVLGRLPALYDLKLPDDRLPSDEEMRLLESELLTFGLAEPRKELRELARRLDYFLERARTFINFGFTGPRPLGGEMAGGVHTDDMPLTEDEQKKRATKNALSEQIIANGHYLKNACDKLDSAVQAEINRISRPAWTRERALAKHSGTRRLAGDLPGLMGPPDPLA